MVVAIKVLYERKEILRFGEINQKIFIATRKEEGKMGYWRL